VTWLADNPALSSLLNYLLLRLVTLFSLKGSFQSTVSYILRAITLYAFIVLIRFLSYLPLL
jgi:hypothetical protein